MRVWAKSEQIAKILKHPTAGGFLWPNSADWPDDTFTYRRMQDGDILDHDPGANPEGVTRTTMGDVRLNEPPTEPVQQQPPQPQSPSKAPKVTKE